MQIFTDRLILQAATPAILSTELTFLQDATQQQRFADALGAQIATWPPLYNDLETCTFALDKATHFPDQLGWWFWHLLLRRDQTTPLLIGSAGFHGPPDATGNVEIGYSIVEEVQRRGYASEAVRAFTTWAFEHEAVTKVTITTLDLPELVPSSKVAIKCGFSPVGSKQVDEGELLIYELSRQTYTQRAKGQQA